MNIAIIGAGMAGASAANSLAKAGHKLQVFDKGRGIGGRLAQRRVAPFVFDHGAQYFTAYDQGFAAIVERWVAQGIAAPWPVDGKTSWIGTPSMSAGAKAFLAGLDVRLSTRITAIKRAADQWHLTDSADQNFGPFDGLILAIPQPQAIELLQTERLLERLASRLQSVQMLPTWTGLFGFESQLPRGVPQGRICHDVIDWIGRNASKAQRGEAEGLTIHARQDWSERHLEADAGEIAGLLFEAVLQVLGSESPPVAYKAAHRWRYAFVDKPLGEPFLGLAEQHIALCGDWCLGPRVEAAFLSGQAAAGFLTAAETALAKQI